MRHRIEEPKMLNLVLCKFLTIFNRVYENWRYFLVSVARNSCDPTSLELSLVPYIFHNSNNIHQLRKNNYSTLLFWLTSDITRLSISEKSNFYISISSIKVNYFVNIVHFSIRGFAVSCWEKNLYRILRMIQRDAF